MDRGDEGSRPEDDLWLSGVHLVILFSVNAVFVLSGSLTLTRIRVRVGYSAV